jgi:dipeptidyl aminopeptidase/acylaminoacyl peptidase
MIAHGTLDEMVSFEQAERLYAALAAAGVEAEFLPLEVVYHNWTPQVENAPGRADTWKLGPLALPFFQRHLCP